MAESINSLYKSELIYNEHEGPWKTVEDVELATLGWVHWWNHERLLEPTGCVPPAEFEANWKRKIDSGITPVIETGGNDHPGFEILDEHPLAGVCS